MSNKIHHFENFSVITDSVEIKVDMSVYDKRFYNAQLALDEAIMTSMVNFMPMDKGSFVARTKGLSAAVAGTGKVFAGAPPEGRFLYEGEIMVDEKTGSPWARKGARKILISKYDKKSADRKEKLDFSKSAHPKVQDHWFDPAKEQYSQKWVGVVAKKLEGG